MITLKEYQLRREKLAQALPEGSLAFIPAAKEVLRNGDSHYRFRQDSNFYYLTGFNEPDALLVVAAGWVGQSILFNHPRNPDIERWTGKRMGQDAAIKKLGVQEAYSLTLLDEQLVQLLNMRSAIYCVLGKDRELEQKIMQTWVALKNQARRGVRAPESLCDLEPILSEMRLFKSEAEIALLRRSAEISVAAHKQAMRSCRHLKKEYELEAELLYEFVRQGCQSVAYSPIVGSGENACVLHYVENNQDLGPDDLVLIDAGGEFEGYAADITRTFPTKGQFSSDQKSIYELVLNAQKAGIAAIKPGLPWNAVQDAILELLVKGLCDLGILKGELSDLLTQEAYKPFYMHNSGHWLGLDVHDSGSYKVGGAWRSLEPGMVLTVEPGLYISSGRAEVDKRWWGIGVRIEDDVLVTQTGCDVLTKALPSEISDIEALMSE